MSELESRYKSNAKQPRSPSGTEVFKFDKDPGMSDREARWQFWLALAETGFVTEEVAFNTECYNHANCHAGIGAQGQFVVHTQLGPVLWMHNTKRVYSQSPRGDLLQRLATRFGPYTATFNDQVNAGRSPHTTAATTPPPRSGPALFSATFQ